MQVIVDDWDALKDELGGSTKLEKVGDAGDRKRHIRRRRRRAPAPFADAPRRSSTGSQDNELIM